MSPPRDGNDERQVEHQAQHRWSAEEHSEGVPERLASDLTALYQPPDGVPEWTDREILVRAVELLGYQEQREHRGRCEHEVRAASWASTLARGVAAIGARLADGFARPAPRWLTAGAAAALLLVALLHPPAERGAASGDVDGDGRVTIADALHLACAIERGAHLRAIWDVDANGVVDQSDVRAIAITAVDLSRSARP
jgi:hypothetical protein